MSGYVGRFAPSPTGRLHMGSLVCALASFLDARAHGGLWLVRIEDIDPGRDIAGVDRDILEVLARLGMTGDGPVVYQSQRTELYRAALQDLVARGLVYGCACSRREIAARGRELGLATGVYPGTCRAGTHGRPVRALRFRTGSTPVRFADRVYGDYEQNVEACVGDFVVRRADGLWAYQLAVTVDDHEQGVNAVVRGSDLLDNTPRQILLQRALGHASPSWMHIPVVCGSDGCKLSKQTKAPAVTAEDPLAVLTAAWGHLAASPLMGLAAFKAADLRGFWATALELWRARFAA